MVLASSLSKLVIFRDVMLLSVRGRVMYEVMCGGVCDVRSHEYMGGAWKGFRISCDFLGAGGGGYADVAGDEQLCCGLVVIKLYEIFH
jgi:hypothetical protein